jgi:hypothetical protein
MLSVLYSDGLVDSGWRISVPDDGGTEENLVAAGEKVSEGAIVEGGGKGVCNGVSTLVNRSEKNELSNETSNGISLRKLTIHYR